MDNEIPNYKKKRHKKSVKKSNHAHSYLPCLYFMKDTPNIIFLGDRCVICGKIGSRRMVTESVAGAYSRMLTNDEVLNKYPTLPCFTISFTDKFVLL